MRPASTLSGASGALTSQMRLATVNQGYLTPMGTDTLCGFTLQRLLLINPF